MESSGTPAPRTSRRVRPEVAVEVVRAAGLEPLEECPGSKEPWRCRCTSCDDIVSPRYNTIQQGRGRGCNRCGKVRGGLARRVPQSEAVKDMLAAGVKPLDPYPGAMRPWRSRCGACRREVQPSLHNVRSGQSACAYCAGQKVDVNAAREAMIDVNVLPLADFPGSDEPWECECVICGKLVTPRYSSIKAGQGGCRYCASRAVDIADAEALMRRANLIPQVPWPGADKPWPLQCTACGRSARPAYNNVRRGHAGCGHCAGTVVDPAFARQVMVAKGLKPLTTFPGVHVPWRCRCTACRALVAPRYAGVRAGQGSCRSCAAYGFEPEAPAIVYLVISDVLQAVKIGISNRGTNRLAEHARAGWLVHRTGDRPCVWPTATGRRAEQIEAVVLRWWRDELLVPPAVNRTDMRQGGASETAALLRIDLGLTVATIEAHLARTAATESDTTHGMAQRM